MIKDESFFIEIDREYTEIITNANSSTNSIEGRGTFEIRTEDSKECEWKIRLSHALLVPDNSKIWFQCRAADNEVLFGKDLEIRTKIGTIFPFEEQDNLFLWKTVNSIGSENCNLASGDRLGLWHKRLGRNNIEDLL